MLRYNRTSPNASAWIMTHLLLILALLGLGYLLGSVSAAILTCRALGRADPRSAGSRNPGATNVMRVAGRDAAIITLAGDLLKGVIPVLVARLLTPDPTIWLLAGVGAFLGHLYPVFFGFRGGKGVATALGVLLAATPLAGALTIATWLVVFAIARISGLSALVAFLLAPLWVVAVTPSMAAIGLVGLMSALLFWRHRDNIRSLLQRT